MHFANDKTEMPECLHQALCARHHVAQPLFSPQRFMNKMNATQLFWKHVSYFSPYFRFELSLKSYLTWSLGFI